MWKLLQHIKIRSENFQKVYKKTPMSKSYFSKVPDFYRSSHRRCSVKKGFLERCSQNSQENTWIRDSILIKLQAYGCKKDWHKHFPVNLVKFLRTPFLQNTSRRLLLLLAFQKQPPEVLYEKRSSWKFRKIHRKTPEVCKIFKNTFFTEHLWLFPITLLKWGTANSVWKTSDEYSLSKNTNLRSTVQVYHFFLGSITFQCMFSLVYTVYCQKQPLE